MCCWNIFGQEFNIFQKLWNVALTLFCIWPNMVWLKWAASSEFGTYRLCEQRRFRRACASAQSHQNLRCLLIQAVSQEEPSDRKPDPWPLWMAGHAQLKFVMTECSKTQIRLMGLKWSNNFNLSCSSVKLTENVICTACNKFVWIWIYVECTVQPVLNKHRCVCLIQVYFWYIGNETLAL